MLLYVATAVKNCNTFPFGVGGTKDNVEYKALDIDGSGNIVVAG